MSLCPVLLKHTQAHTHICGFGKNRTEFKKDSEPTKQPQETLKHTIGYLHYLKKKTKKKPSTHLVVSAGQQKPSVISMLIAIHPACGVSGGCSPSTPANVILQPSAGIVVVSECPKSLQQPQLCFHQSRRIRMCSPLSPSGPRASSSASKKQTVKPANAASKEIRSTAASSQQPAALLQ